MSKTASNAGLGCFAIFWSLITLIFDGFIGYSVYNQIRAEGFPTTNGRVTHSEVSVHHGESTTYGIEIEFEYEVNGQRYMGEKERYGSMNTSDRDYAKDFVDEHPPGKDVTVYYNPNDPADAILMPGVQSMDLFIALFMTPFNMVMLGLWCAIGGNIMRKYRDVEAGGVPILRRSYGVHLRIPTYSALMVAGSVGGLVAFLGIFVVAFFFSMGGSMTPVLVVWGCVLGTAVVTYCWNRFRTGAGLNDLIIDLENKEFSLPQTYGRDGAQTYPLDWIDDVDMRTEIHRGSKGSTTTKYVPTLNYTDDKGTTHNEKLGEWYYEDAAQSLTDWLNNRISREARDLRKEV